MPARSPGRSMRRRRTERGRRALALGLALAGAAGAHAQTDFLMPYLRYVFATVGIRQVEGIRLQNTARGADSAMRTLEGFRQELAARMLLMPLVA